MRIGLVDTGVGPGAAVTLACFGAPGGGALPEHGDASVALLAARVPGAAILFGAVAGAGGAIEPAAVAAALAWLLDAGAGVIAVPLGSEHDHAEVGAAIDRALARGVTVVAAAGDSHPAPLLFPARHPGVLAAGAVDRRGRLLPECNRSPRLDVRAPGLVRVAAADGRTALRRGSSIACVLAAATLARAAQPEGEPA